MGKPSERGAVRLVRLDPGRWLEVAAVAARSFPTPWDGDTTRQVLASPHCRALGVEDEEGVLLGHVLFGIQGELCHLLEVAVLPEHRRRGLGTRLVEAACAEARAAGATSAFLEVRPGSAGAIRFYEAQGFWQLGTKPGYYPDTGEDALVLTRTTAAPAGEAGESRE